ncbi:MAG: iron-sulfur cluster biosynthesis transcriptional regulator SufR [Moorea sp. SIO2B7]|nr:iron-sulfur cluster biosynthesis transcriptional regulator SufR [Moorena sp. SIO2B7]
MTTTHHPSTKKDIMQFLLKEGQATAHQLAETLAISPQATRRHLKDLQEEGLIEYQSIQNGMGRPNHVYQLSRLGRDRFPHRYNEFAISFLDALVETAGEEQVEAVLRKQWKKKAEEYRDRIGNASLEERVNNLVRLRQEEGYMAELHGVEGSNSKKRFLLAEHNCAISDVAESFPVVCGNELEMFSAILPDCTVERTNWINNGENRCGYLIEMKD